MVKTAVKRLSFEQVRAAYALVYCLKQDLRQLIIALLHRHLELTAPEIASKLGIESSLAHHHLSLLVEAGVVEISTCPTCSVFKLNYLILTKYLSALKSLGG
ncbi:MAG: winged helix-turn-helix transcriptional regulator [Sphingomonadales bacterium]|nr:winged helix-turn-helix transcriptional regulator [Sphingomonadales bacterium]